jgi:hypothetical protein
MLLKIEIVIIGAMGVAAVATTFVLQHEAQVQLREEKETFRRQTEKLSKLQAENGRLSNLLAQAKSLPTENQTAELARHRPEAEMPGKQTNEPGKQSVGNRLSEPPQTSPKPDDYSEEHYVRRNEIPSGKMEDAKILSVVLGDYAREHQGKFPSIIDQVKPYMLKRKKSLTGTNEFDIVFQGSLDTLTNIPRGSVAVLRDRQTWVAPSGKKARVYGLADGSAETIEADDNFQAWEAEHILPSLRAQ